MPGFAGRVSVGVVALAPAAVGILLELEPFDGAPHRRIIAADVRLREGRNTDQVP